MTFLQCSPTKKMGAGWRSWQMVLHCGEEPSSQLTRQWCPPSEETAQLGQGQLIDGAVLEVALVVLAAEVGGRWNRRRRSSSQFWPEHGLKKCLWSCKVELRPQAKVERHPCVHCRACFQSFSAGQSSSWLRGCCPFRPRGLEGGPFFLSTGVFCFS